MNLVTWVGTPLEIVRKMLDMAHVGSEDTVYDLGTGDARILITAVKDFGVRKAVGYEIREDLCEISERKVEQVHEGSSLSVPWLATPMNIVKKMLQVAQVTSEDVVYDLGCGDARILIAAVEEFGAKRAVGYEIRQDLYEAAMHMVQHKNLHDRIVLINKDFFEADVSEASVVTLYLSNQDLELLRPKFEREAKCGTRIVSHQFKINTWRARAETAVRYWPRMIYLYVIPEAFQPASRYRVRKLLASLFRLCI